MAKTIRMIRSELDAGRGPVAADVHPDEVANYEAGGWRVAKPEKPVESKAGESKDDQSSADGAAK